MSEDSGEKRLLDGSGRLGKMVERPEPLGSARHRAGVAEDEQPLGRPRQRQDEVAWVITEGDGTAGVTARQAEADDWTFPVGEGGGMPDQDSQSGFGENDRLMNEQAEQFDLGEVQAQHGKLRVGIADIGKRGPNRGVS